MLDSIIYVLTVEIKITVGNRKGSKLIGSKEVESMVKSPITMRETNSLLRQLENF